MSEPDLTQGLILAVEDEPELLELLVFNLKKAGYDVVTAATGREALAQSQQHAPDLVLLDLMLPELSGTEVASRLRSNPKTESIPIIMLTAKAEEAEEIIGLTAGADDYITKPYSMKVLLARIEAVLRRSLQDTEDDQPSAFGPITINPLTHEAKANNKLLNLTLTEFKLLDALVAAAGKVLSRSTLMSHAMGPGVMVTQRTIDVHITALRRKLGEFDDHGDLIQTVRGVGYQLDPSLATAPAP